MPDNDFLLDPQQLAPLLKPGQMVLLGQPNNPTGRTFAAAALRDLAASHPASLFVVDESFIGFTDASQSLQQDRPANLLVVPPDQLYAIPGCGWVTWNAAEEHIKSCAPFCLLGRSTPWPRQWGAGGPRIRTIAQYPQHGDPAAAAIGQMLGSCPA